MCTGIEIAMVAGAAVSAGTAIYAGAEQKKTQNAIADQAEADADAARGQAMVEAAKIRKAAQAQRGQAVAALAASGVDVSAGTAEQIQVDIDQRGEEDALNVILSGGNRARYGEAEAGMARRRGSQAMTAGYLNATSSVLSSVTASQRASGWKSTGKGWSSGAGDGFYSNPQAGP